MDISPLVSLQIFGYIMIAMMLQLLVIGSIIQRGKESFLADFQKKGITNMPMYCKMFGNRLILLGIIAGACAWFALKATEATLSPIIIFGLGIVLVIVLMIIDHAKYSK